MPPEFEVIRQKLRAFVEAREWDTFHAPKDLAVSLSLEAAELLEIFQWRDPRATELTPDDRTRISDELADVTMYAMLLADKTGIDLLTALDTKLAKNAEKYPADKARGRPDKYDRL